MDDAGLFASNRRIVLSNNDDTKIIEAPIPRSALLECTKFQLGAYTVFRVLTAAITILAGTMSRSEGRNGVTGRRRRWWSPHKKIAGSNCGLATERVLKEITTIRRVIDYALQSEHTRRPGTYRLRGRLRHVPAPLEEYRFNQLGTSRRRRQRVGDYTS